MRQEYKAGIITLVIGLTFLCLMLWIFLPSKSAPVVTYEPGDISYYKLAGPYVQEAILVHKDPHNPTYWIVKDSKRGSSFLRIAESELMGVKESQRIPK